ncbi:hypothetical protein V6N11_077410 [Hibiscus sabdariffa]|uniref:CBS domain-containing protein n=1 Tax=Hibiscus sabdariffa TaxID=183260 RepID=A0ABR2TD02_9ROSI
MQASTSKDTVNVTVNDSSTELWHKRLSHISEKGIKCLAKKNKLSWLKNATLKNYACCLVRKQKRVSFSSRPSHRKSELLELVHLDVCGPKKVKDVRKRLPELPICKEGDLIIDQLPELTRKGCGCLLVIDDEYHLLGTFTDGDLHRTLDTSGDAIFKLTVGEMCNRELRTIGPDAMAAEAMQKMESSPSPVQFLAAIDHQNILIGIVTLHGLVWALLSLVLDVNTLT